MDFVRLDFRYREALRQRASKAKLFAELILAPHKEESQQRITNSLLNKMLHPHGKIKTKEDQQKIDDTWDLLRKKLKK